jgi:hypothetical protein
MSKEKQIEEIAKILLIDCEGACTDCEYYGRYDGSLCIPMRLANELYKQGYHKQSEVIDEFAERLKKRLYDKSSIFTQQRYIVNDEIDNLVEEMKGGAE